MSDEEENATGQPEFVAVTPRGVVPGPAAPESEAAPEPVVEPERPAAEPGDVAARELDDAGPPLVEPVAGPPVAVEREPEPAPTAAAPTAAEPTAPAPTPAESTAAESAASEPDPAPAAAPGPAPAPAPAPDAVPTPDPAPASAGEAEVSVRVAAEGMAAALAGEPSHEADARHASDRSVGPMAMATAVCVVLTLAAATVLGIAARRNSHDRQIAEARSATGTAVTSALVAAKKETAAALSYDYRTLDADFQRAEAGMSRKFRANYAQTAANSVTPLAQRTHAVTTGTVAAAGVVSATPTTARILVFADQTVQNKLLNATSRLDRSVIEVSMVKENGRWVIDNLQPF